MEVTVSLERNAWNTQYKVLVSEVQIKPSLQFSSHAAILATTRSQVLVVFLT